MDPVAQGGDAPTGWYLTGLLVDPAARRRGLATQLTRERLERLSAVTSNVWYFTNVRNAVSTVLHERLGFRLQTHEFTIPGVTFEGGQGALYFCQLAEEE